MEPGVKPWPCFAFRKNNIEVKCALTIMSVSLLECSLWISDRRSRNIHFGLPPHILDFFSLAGLDSHFLQRTVGQDFTIPVYSEVCVH